MAKKEKKAPKKAARKSKKAVEAPEEVQADQPKGTRPKGPEEAPRLFKRYREEIIPALKEKLELLNVHQVPVLDKIVINMGIGSAIDEPKKIDAAVKDLTAISGQRPVITRAKKAVSAFRLRKNLAIGCMVTLRHYRMYEFLDRFIHVALPRVRDFRGVRPQGFDTQGNYNMGMTEQTIFPEVSLDTMEFQRGMDIAFVIRNSQKDASRELLSLFGMPFAN